MSFNVVGIGEVLWDLLPSGPQLGGAPANFAYHAHALGAQAKVVTRVGNDALGREILDRFRSMGLSEKGVQVDQSASTGTVAVTLSGDGNPHFTILESVAWDCIAATSEALDAVREASAVCFGSLAQRNPSSRAAIQKLLTAVPTAALRVFDINLRQSFYSCEIIEQSLKLPNLLKLNDGELVAVSEMFSLRGNSEQQVKALADQFGLRAVVLTRGADGSLIYERGRWSEQRPKPVHMVDTVGAGDSFTAALVLGLLHEEDLDSAHAFAAEVARYVCSCVGATPPLPDQFRNRFARSL